LKDLTYLSGFGNHFSTQIRPGLLPMGQNSPQQVASGLYAELLSGSAFTAPRHANQRTWLYRRGPSVLSQPSTPYPSKRDDPKAVWLSDAEQAPVSAPDPMRWAPFDYPSQALDFVDGMVTLAVNGSTQMQAGVAIHVYLIEQSMRRKALRNNDAEMLIVPQEGCLLISTECGQMDVMPGEIAVMPRGMSFKVNLKANLKGDDETSHLRGRGYVCENFGASFRLPELGPIGSNGLANARDFLAPVAWVEDGEGSVEPYELVRKSGGKLWTSLQNQSPFNVAAWHGNLVPYKYNTANFMVLGSISFDHPDPSIFTVLTSPSDTAGTANCDFVIFPPRWLVAEHSFRPPWFHRNIMSEFMGLVHGQYDAKEKGFRPGGASLHNSMVPHGPDLEAFAKASQATLTPQKLDNTLAFMFESRYLLRPTAYAIEHPGLERDYWQCWQGL
jgi:homogentisate 1,2-dioxygenase